jgi:hypothetical protein
LRDNHGLAEPANGDRQQAASTCYDAGQPEFDVALVN